MKHYFNNYSKMLYWFKTQLWIKKGIMKPSQISHFANLFPPTIQQYGHRPMEDNFNGDIELYSQFYVKYPEAIFANKYYQFQPDQYAKIATDPAKIFVHKQKKYMKDGFSQAKAFELAEKDMSSTLQKEKNERALLEGVATSNRARSLMSLYEQDMEYEARQKIERLGREVGEFKRIDDIESARMDELMGRTEHFIPVQGIEKDRRNKLNQIYEPVTCNNNLLN